MTKRQMKKLENRLKAFETILSEKTGITSRTRWLDKSRIEVEKSTLTNEEKVWLLVRMLKAYNQTAMQ